MLIATKGFFDALDRELYNVRHFHSKTFPKYDILKNGNDYQIIVALAGYKKADISASLHDDEANNRKILRIEGKVLAEDKPENHVEYIYRGLARRDFVQDFSLTMNTVISHVKFEHGLLTVTINLEIPEEKKPKQLDIA